MSSAYFDMEIYKSATLSMVPEADYLPSWAMDSNSQRVGLTHFSDYHRLKTPGKNLWIATWGDGISALIPVWKDYEKPSIKVVVQAFHRARFTCDYVERLTKNKEEQK